MLGDDIHPILVWKEINKPLKDFIELEVDHLGWTWLLHVLYQFKVFGQFIEVVVKTADHLRCDWPLSFLLPFGIFIFEQVQILSDKSLHSLT